MVPLKLGEYLKRFDVMSYLWMLRKYCWVVLGFVMKMVLILSRITTMCSTIMKIESDYPRLIPGKSDPN